jgi:hypothetical protein
VFTSILDLAIPIVPICQGIMHEAIANIPLMGYNDKKDPEERL